MSSKDTKITHGSRVTLEYMLSLEDGTIVDQSQANEPMVLTIGQGDMIEGLEQALLGMQAGDKSVSNLTPEQAFGFPDDAAIQWMDRDQFPDDLVPAKNQIIGFTLPDGTEVPGAIKGVEGTRVLVDLNHPLAGHHLTFEVSIQSVVANTLDK